MHDPKTVAFDIPNIFVKKRHGHWPALITIWHVDPETDGSDDSCGWFKRARHGDKKVLEKIQNEFAFNFKHKYWFDEDGKPVFSTIGTVLNMYSAAHWIVCGYNRRKHQRFMNKHLYEILSFAENPVDSMHGSIHMIYGKEKAEYRIEHFASIVYGDILRKQQKWYQHPRWHIHHWEVQFRPWQQLKCRYWDKCSGCGKRGFKGSAMGEWSGERIWHPQCYEALNKPEPVQQ